MMEVHRDMVEAVEMMEITTMDTYQETEPTTVQLKIRKRRITKIKMPVAIFSDMLSLYSRFMIFQLFTIYL
jgi:hypothetical protein